MNKIKQLVDFLQEKRGYFFLARLCLRVGRDLTRVEEGASEDPELLKKIIKAAKELGVSERELGEAILEREYSFR